MPKKPVTHRPNWIAPKEPNKMFDRPRSDEEKNIYNTVYNTPRWRAIRDLVRQRDPICKRCNCEPTHTIDHIIPIRNGGDAWDMSNMQGLCKRCNISKTSKQKGNAF